MKQITSPESIEQLQAFVVANPEFNAWQIFGDIYTIRDGDLVMFNYTARAQYAGRWNFIERISRGLILNIKTGEIVARPFDKFFNWLEKGQASRGHIVTISEKVDGSMITLYRDPVTGEYKGATRGSFNSTQALWATEQLKRYDLSDLDPAYTLIFEAVYPSNRVVVNYGDREALVLLAVRNRFTGAYLPYFPDVYEIAQRYGFEQPAFYAFNAISDIIESCGSISENNEGYVVQFSDGSFFKFKGDRYRELHKLLSGVSWKTTLAAMEDNTIQSLIDSLPDEFMNIVVEWRDYALAVIESETNKAKQLYESIRPTCSTRKQFATFALSKDSLTKALLFALEDQKDLNQILYHYLKNIVPPMVSRNSYEGN